MAHGEVVGLKNVELVMGGILEGDCEKRMTDRLLRSYRKCSDFELYSVVNGKPVEVTESLTC